MKCCDINAGMLRIACTFERKTQTPDAAGGWTETWTAISGAPTRCHFKAMSGGERWQALRVEATSRNRITTRFDGTIVEGDRVTIKGRAYNIRFVENVELRDRWLVCEIDGGVAV